MEKRRPPIELLPQSVQDAIAAVKDLHHAPEEMTLATCLAIMAYTTQGLSNVDTLTFGEKPLSNFFFVLAKSGGAKTTIHKTLSAGIERWKGEAKQAFDREKERWALEKELWDQQWQKAKKIKDDDERRSELVALKQIEPRAPLDPGREVEQPTQVGLFRKLEKAEPSCCLVTSEGGQFLASHAFQDSSTMIHLATTLTKLWDGQSLSRDTGDESKIIEDRRFSCLIMTQEDVAVNFLTHPILDGQGLLARFLVSECPQWKLPHMDLSREAERHRRDAMERLERFHLRTYELMNRSLPTREGDPQRLAPPVIGWSEAAKAHLQEWFNTTVWPCLEEGPFFARQNEHAIRLAGMLAVFDGRAVIDLAEIKAATALVDWFADVRRNLDLGAGDERHTDERPIAEKLHKWLMSKQKDRLTKTDIHLKSPRAFRSLNWDKQRKILAAMVAWDWLEEAVTVDQQGRETTVWLVNPA